MFNILMIVAAERYAARIVYHLAGYLFALFDLYKLVNKLKQNVLRVKLNNRWDMSFIILRNTYMFTEGKEKGK